MSRETEKVLKQLMQYMEDHQDELDDGADENALAQQFDEYLDKMNPYGYRPFTIEELIHDHFENQFLFDSVDFFFDWAHRSLNRSSNSKPTSK